MGVIWFLRPLLGINKCRDTARLNAHLDGHCLHCSAEAVLQSNIKAARACFGQVRSLHFSALLAESTTVLVPAMGESITEGSIATVLKNAGGCLWPRHAGMTGAGRAVGHREPRGLHANMLPSARPQHAGWRGLCATSGRVRARLVAPEWWRGRMAATQGGWQWCCPA